MLKSAPKCYLSEHKHLHITGELSFATVMQVRAQANELLRPLTEWHIDLSRIEQSDTSTIALLLSWVQAAERTAKKIYFHHLPARLLAIAKLSGVAGLLASVSDKSV